MDTTVQVDVLIKNVKRFVKKCREKNQELLKFNHLHPIEDAEHSNINVWEHSVFERYLKQNSSFFSDKSIDDKKADGYIKFESTVVRDVEDLNSEEKLLHVAIDESSQELKIEDGNHEGNEETIQGNLDHEDNHVEHSMFTTNSLTKKESLSTEGEEHALSKNGSIIMSHTTKNITEEMVLGSKASSNESEDASVKTKMKALDTLRSEMMEEDLELLRMYNKLERSSQTLMLAKGKKQGKKKVLHAKPITKKTSEVQVIKKKKSKKLKKVPILNLKTNKSVNFSEQLQKRGSKNVKMIKRSSSNTAVSQASLRLSTGKKDTKPMMSKSNSSSKKLSSDSLSKTPSKKGSDRIISFHEGLKNRLQKNTETNSSYNIGCMYIKNEMSESEWNTFRKYGKTKSSKHFKNQEHVNTLINKKNSSGLFNESGRSMEGTLRRPKLRKQKCESDVIAIINGLLKDYVPKLIARYDSCIQNMNKENVVLKKKIRESLDFGDLQYEEIRELKMQVVHLNNKNKKMNDIITTLREKISNVEELDAKNMEYLDEIMILKNKISFLERVIEENDHTKKGIELKQMRHSVRTMYNNLRNQMKYMQVLKKKYKRRNKKKKFCFKKYMELEEYQTQFNLSDDSIESIKASVVFPHCLLDEEIIVPMEENKEENVEPIEETPTPIDEVPVDTNLEGTTSSHDDSLIDQKEEEPLIEEKECEVTPKFSYAMSNIEMETLLIFDNFFKLLMKDKDEKKQKRILKSLPKKMHHFCRYMTEHSDSSERTDSDQGSEEEKSVTVKEEPIEKTKEPLPDPPKKNVATTTSDIKHYRNLRLEGIVPTTKKNPLMNPNHVNVDIRKTKVTKEESTLKCLEKIKNCLCNNLACCPMKPEEHSSSDSSDNVPNMLLKEMKKEVHATNMLFTTTDQRELDRTHFTTIYDLLNHVPKEYCIEEITPEGFPIITKPSTRVFETMSMMKTLRREAPTGYTKNVQKRNTHCSTNNTNYNNTPVLLPAHTDINYHRQRISSMNNLKIPSVHLVHNK